MNLRYSPITKANWHELETFLESRGCPHYCWCMVWRNMIPKSDRSSKADKKTSLKKYVDDNLPVGFLTYNDDQPIAWCSIAPRETHRALGGDDRLEDVWSLTCFFIKREYRKQNLGKSLIEQAIHYAKQNGAKYLEAYPVEPTSTSYRFMGITNQFEKAGFKYVKDAGSRRKVMVKKIRN